MIEMVYDILILLLKINTMKYILWQNISANANRNIHPNTDWFYEFNWEWTLTETCFSDWNGLYIGVLDNPTIPELPFNFQIVEKTESEINNLLETWYGLDKNNNPYVSASNYSFTDNRPTDI